MHGPTINLFCNMFTSTRATVFTTAIVISHEHTDIFSNYKLPNHYAEVPPVYYCDTD